MTYQNLARRFRPQKFKDVIGQGAIVTTLKNALRKSRVSHAYLFCGNRGSGKTTLARLFAKAINCENPQEGEPCNECRNCQEIMRSASLDVIEIDGASNRGIDDIRHINETAGYAPSSGKSKIYIIDEVHMLTKEAFNALLKTLEEPPEKVKFFFATTEPHKVLPTILSRCQRFDLRRIQTEDIVKKLEAIAEKIGKKIEKEALFLIARFSEGSLRDAESFLDQILCFEEGVITEKTVADSLGVVTKEFFFELDQAIEKGDVSFAFAFTKKMYDQGKDFTFLLDELLTHFRNHLAKKVAGKPIPYSQEELLFLLDEIIEVQGQVLQTSMKRIAMEMLLLKLIRAKSRVSLDSLVQRLFDLEKGAPEELPPKAEMPPPPELKTEAPPQEAALPQQKAEAPPQEMSAPPEPPKQETPLPKEEPKIQEPKLIEIPFSLAPLKKPDVQALQEKIFPKSKASYDTLFRFAAVELEGTMKQ